MPPVPEDLPLPPWHTVRRRGLVASLGAEQEGNVTPNNL